LLTTQNSYLLYFPVFYDSGESRIPEFFASIPYFLPEKQLFMAFPPSFCFFLMAIKDKSYYEEIYVLADILYFILHFFLDIIMVI